MKSSSRFIDYSIKFKATNWDVLSNFHRKTSSTLESGINVGATFINFWKQLRKKQWPQCLFRGDYVYSRGYVYSRLLEYRQILLFRFQILAHSMSFLSFNSFYDSRFCRNAMGIKVFLNSSFLNSYFPSNSWDISNSFNPRYWQIEKYFVEFRAQRFNKINAGIGPIVFFVLVVICPIYFSCPFFNVIQ